MTLIRKNSVMGALVGCAVGDAMGAPFEGLWAESVPGTSGLLRAFHEYHGFPRGQYTDDTQLTMATIRSLVANRGIDVRDIAIRISELWRHHSVIGPGGACTQAAERFLLSGDHRDMGAPVGQAGNGTAMRTVAVGLWFKPGESALVPAVSEISRITHQDPRSIAGGIAVAVAANAVATNPGILSEPFMFSETIAEAVEAVCPEMSALLRELPGRISERNVAEFISNAGQTRAEFTRPIISPFVVPTVLAVVYALLKHPDSWSASVTVAIGLGGDVDTLGAIVATIAGAAHGIDSIPNNLRANVQDRAAIEYLAAEYWAVIAAREEV